MARSYAQLAAIVFVVVGVGGFLTGDASQVVHGQASGNFDGVALHLTYTRDVIDLLLAAAFVYAGFVADDATSSRIVLGASAFLLLLAIVGFLITDNDAGGRSLASLHFPIAIDIFDLVAGTLGLLCGLGGAEEGAAASR